MQHDEFVNFCNRLQTKKPSPALIGQFLGVIRHPHHCAGYLGSATYQPEVPSTRNFVAFSTTNLTLGEQRHTSREFSGIEFFPGGFCTFRIFRESNEENTVW